MRDFESVRRVLRLAPQGRLEIEREVDEELEAHIAMRIEHYIARGMSPEAARAEALRRLGDVGTAREALIGSIRRREGRMRIRSWLDSVRQDAVHALRQIRRAPAFSGLAITTFALAIGLTTAIFAAVDGVLLRPLPFEEPDRLVALQSMDSSGMAIEVVSADNWLDWDRGARTLAGSAIHFGNRSVVSSGGDGLRVASELVSPGFFDVIRPRFISGRGFSEEDARTSAAVAVISEGLWRGMLGGRSLEQLSLSIAGRPTRVIGVVASGHEYPAGTQLWTAYRHVQMGGGVRNNVNWLAVGRLAPGATISLAREELNGIARRIREAEPVALYSWGVPVLPLRDVVLGRTPEYLRLLMGAVGFVMLIACANLAGANLARGASRRREMAVRAALGAGRGRIARQLFVEHLVLALLGGAAGVALAWLLTRAVSAAASTQIPRASEIGLDVRVLTFAFVLSTIAGLLAGMLPARDAARASLRGGLTRSGHGVLVGGRGIPGRILVGFEVAIAVLLVVGAGLLVQSFRSLLARPLGFETRSVVVADISLAGTRYASGAGRVTGYWPALIEALRAIPGVDGASVTSSAPLGLAGSGFIEIEAKDVPGAGAGYRVVGDGYFHTLGVPVLTGRDFGPGDDTTSLRGVIVNRTMSERYWPGESPIGKRVRASSMESRFGSPAPWLTVIGVVGDLRHWGHEDDYRPEMYVSHVQSQFGLRLGTVVVRGRLGEEALIAAVRERIRAVDTTVPADIEPLSARADRLTAERRLTMSLLTIFGCLALALAAVGVYALLSFSVAQRTRELAVRSALGADRSQIIRLVLVAGAWVIGAGVLTGTAGAFALSRLIESFLYEVSPHDPIVLGTAVLTIAAVGLLAATVPALRAARVEPMVVLMGE